MLITEFVDSVAGRYERELDHVFKEQVKTAILISRAEAIRQYTDKYKAIPAGLITQIHCMKMIQADVAECCSIEIGCKVWKTQEKVPVPIRVRGLENNFKFVGTIDNSNAFTYIQPEQMADLTIERFLPTDKIFYSYINERIYVYNRRVNNVRVRGVFNDPYKVFDLNDCTGDGCDEVLNIPDDFLYLIKDLVYRQLDGLPIEEKEEEVKIEEDA